MGREEFITKCYALGGAIRAPCSIDADSILFYEGKVRVLVFAKDLGLATIKFKGANHHTTYARVIDMLIGELERLDGIRRLLEKQIQHDLDLGEPSC